MLALKKDNVYTIHYKYNNGVKIYNINSILPLGTKYLNNTLTIDYNANLYSEGTISIKGFSDISFKFTIVHEDLKASLSVDDNIKKAYLDVSNIYNLVSFRYEINNNAEKKEYVENITTGKTRYDLSNKIFLNNNINVQFRMLNFIVRHNSNTITISNANTNYNFINASYVFYYGGGYGTEASPYLIFNERHLINTTIQIIKNLSNPAKDEYIVFKLNNDINLYGTNWSPKDFYGELNGGGKKITNFSINISSSIFSQEMNYGLFATNYGYIHDLIIPEVSIYGGSQHNPSFVYAGSICGTNANKISNCNVYGTVEVHRAYSYIGGITGKNIGIINDCKFGDWLKASHIKGNGDMGGIAGANIGGTIIKSIIQLSYVELYVAYINRSAGGIAGYCDNGGTIQECQNGYSIIKCFGYGEIANPEPCIGIIAGYFSNSNLISVGNVYGKVDKGSLTNEQAKYVGTGYWGEVGRYVGNNNVV